MKKQIFYLASTCLWGLIGCVAPQTKLKEAEKVNALAEEKGFLKSPKDAVSAEMKRCVPQANLKWELKLTEQGPFVQQKENSETVAYGPYQVICFQLPEGGKKKIMLSTTHQGGGYSKAYYVLPFYSLYTKDLQLLPLNQKLDFKQEPWSGDYKTEFPIELKANQTYFFYVEANNRHPELSWNQYANTGLGWALQGVFPIEVRSSPYGVVKVEILPP